MDKFRVYRLREADRKVTAAFERGDARRARRRRGGGARRLFRRQLQGRARRHRHGPDHPALPVHRRHRPVGHGGRVERSARSRRATRCSRTSYDIGVAHDGGYAEYARIPADWAGPDAEGHEPLRGDGPRHGGLHRGASRSCEWSTNGLKPGNGPVVVDRRDRRRRLDRDRHPRRARLSRGGGDRQGAGVRLPEGPRRQGGDAPLRASIWRRSNRSTRRCGRARWTTSAATCSPGSRAP